MKKKDLKLIIIGAIVILCGALMFFDKIAEIAKIDTTQVPFSVINTVSIPFVSIRKSIRQEDLLDRERSINKDNKEYTEKLQEKLDNTEQLNRNQDKRVIIYYGECSALYGDKDLFGRVIYKTHYFYYAEGRYFNTLADAKNGANLIREEYLNENYRPDNVIVREREGVNDTGEKFQNLNSLKLNYNLK